MQFDHDLLVLRHGETEWNRAGRMQGAMDSPLTDEGEAQARTQGAILARLQLTGFGWFCSPQGRAVATSKLVAPDQVFTLDDRLVEITMGRWTGATRSDIRAEAPALFDDPTSFAWYDAAPGGEGFAGLEARCREFLADLGGPAVLVTHGITSRFLRTLAMGLPIQDFAHVGGGQGVVFRIRNGQQEVLGTAGTAE